MSNNYLGAPEREARPQTVNIGDAARPETPEELNVGFCSDSINEVSRFFNDGENRFFFVKNEDADGKVAFVTNCAEGIGVAGNYRVLTIDVCALIDGRDSNGRAIKIRQHTISKDSRSGEPIYSSEIVSLWRMLELYTPHESWMQASEWKAKLKKIGPEIARDKANELGDEAARRVRDEQSAQQFAAKRNPSEFLAGALASGIANALRELGVTSKTAPAK
jgi:hypothetical protein